MTLVDFNAFTQLCWTKLFGCNLGKINIILDALEFK